MPENSYEPSKAEPERTPPRKRYVLTVLFWLVVFSLPFILPGAIVLVSLMLFGID